MTQRMCLEKSIGINYPPLNTGKYKALLCFLGGYETTCEVSESIVSGYFK